MPVAPDSERDAAPRASVRDRVLLALPKAKSSEEKTPLGAKLRNAMLKKVDFDESSEPEPEAPKSVDELEETVSTADDKERLIGLIAAPLAALIGLLITGSLIDRDPPARLKDGAINSLHVNVSIYHDLTLALLGLSVVILFTAWYRKRLFLGIALALYGLAVFNLHFWGFGVPFLLAGAWYLVRAYRYQRELREATEGGSSASRSTGARPASSKRYTPPAPKRPSVKA